MEAAWFGLGLLTGAVVGVAALVVMVVRWIFRAFEDGDSAPEPIAGTIADRRVK